MKFLRFSKILCVFYTAADAENGTSKSGRRQSQNSRRRSTQKSSRVPRQQKKNKNKTASQDCSSLSEKSDAMANVTVLTPPAAMSLSHRVSIREPCHKPLSSDLAPSTDQDTAAAATDVQTPPVLNVIISPPTDEKKDDKVGSPLHCDIASVKAKVKARDSISQHSVSNNATKQQHDKDKEVSALRDDKAAGSSVVTLPANRGTEVPGKSTEAGSAVKLCSESCAKESSAVCVAGDANANISDSSFHLDTQMLCAIAGPAAGDADEMRDVLPPAVAEMLPVTDGNKIISEDEMDMMGLSSATCCFMKEFSTQQGTVQTNAAITKKIGDCDGGQSCVVTMPVETVADPQEPKADLSVSATSELVAASNFDRICAASDNEVNRQIAYSEEMLFDEDDECVQVHLTDKLLTSDKRKHRLSAGMNNRISSDAAEKLAVDDCVENKSDLFASYVEEPDVAVRADVCLTDLPAENSFGLEHDSLTGTMLDRAMAVANEVTVGNHLEAIKCPPVSAADAKLLRDANSNVAADDGDALRNHNIDVLVEPPGIDAEAALNLLCESFHKSTKKPPKRRGRKRNSNSADPLFNTAAVDVEEKRRRTLSDSSPLLAGSERSELNEAVCGQTSFSVSFASTSDSSAYVPPTPPSTATEKSNVNTPRRLLGGVAGVTPVKSGHFVHPVSGVKKNTSQFNGHVVKEERQHKAGGIAHCEVKTDDTSPPFTQAMQSSQSFTIIDVASNRLLFDTFIAEWQRQQSFSLSLACEKHPKPRKQRQSAEGIGQRFTRGNKIDELVKVVGLLLILFCSSLFTSQFSSVRV